jgi:hypothetical protein
MPLKTLNFFSQRSNIAEGNSFLMKREVIKRDEFFMGSCPRCGSGRTKIYKTVRPRRKIKCLVCAARWTTLEIILPENWNYPLKISP